MDMKERKTENRKTLYSPIFRDMISFILLIVLLSRASDFGDHSYMKVIFVFTWISKSSLFVIQNTDFHVTNFKCCVHKRLIDTAHISVNNLPAATQLGL